MSYAEKRVVNFCGEHDCCGKALVKLYTTTKDQWTDASDLRAVCGIDRSVWMSFLNRASTKRGAGIIEIKPDPNRNNHTMIRIPTNKLDNVKNIINELYGWVE